MALEGRPLAAPSGLPTAAAKSQAAKIQTAADWARAHADAAAALAKRRDADGPVLDRALARVRKFLAARQLLVFGGFAIDCALRLRGASIYPDEERPDYDALSPRAIDDAYELADELHAAGFEHVDAIRAVHVQTMRVRVNFRPVADLGHIPADVYARIPALAYEDLRVAHPDFQRMDMHLAFCYPYSGAPREDVYHRWRKDLKRYNLLAAHYPVAGLDAAAGAVCRAELGAADGAYAFTGFAGYAILRAEVATAAHLLGAALQLKAPELEFVIEGPQVRLGVPGHARAEVVVVSPHPDRVAGPAAVEYEPYADVYPALFERAGADGSALVALSTRGRLVAAATVSAATATKLGHAPDAPRLLVASPQHVLLYLLQWANRSEGAARDVYRAYYAHTLEIIAAAETLFARPVQGPATAYPVSELFAQSPFAPSTGCLGTVNTDAAYIIKMASNAARLHDVPPAELGLGDISGVLVGLPTNYYPGRGRTRPAFDPAACPIYQRSGVPVKKGAQPSARGL